MTIRLSARRDDHDWSQRHLSHYVEGDLAARTRRRLERHAAECPECSRGIRAMKALLRLIPGLAGDEDVRAPDHVFERLRDESSASPGSSGAGEDAR